MDTVTLIVSLTCGVTLGLGALLFLTWALCAIAARTDDQQGTR